MNRDREYLDCDTGTVIEGIRQSQSGQITRLYYEAVGNPSHNPGEQDPGKTDSRKVLTLRAVEAMKFPMRETPTIVFVDENDKRYWYVSMHQVEPEYADMVDMRSKGVLVDGIGDDLREVGCHVAFAIPNNGHMSPQLK